MELIQAGLASSLSPQGAAAGSHPLLAATAAPPHLDHARADVSGPNATCRNWTGPGPEGGGADPGSAPLPTAAAAAIVIPIMYAAVCAVGLAGNTLVIYVLLRRHGARSQSVTNIYILNLAIADQLFMLGLPFLAVQNALLSWPFGTLMCRVVMTVDAINQFTSIFCLTVMSLDRYLAVAQPVRCAGWRRPRVARAVNGAVWAVSFVVVLPVVAFADVLEDDGNCSIVWPEPAQVWKASFIVYTTTVGFLCPLLVICLCYLLIVVKVRRSGKRVRATSSRRRKSERKVTRMVVVVVAVFVLCWLPFYVLNIANLLVVLPGDLRGLYVSVVVLSYANSCANPILYGCLSDSFKRGFRQALCRSSRRVQNHGRAAAEVGRGLELRRRPTGGVAPPGGSGGQAGAEEEKGRRVDNEEEEESRGFDEDEGGGARSRACAAAAEGGEGEGDEGSEGSPGVKGDPAPASVQTLRPAEGPGPLGASEAECTLGNGGQITTVALQHGVDHSVTLEVSQL